MVNPFYDELGRTMRRSTPLYKPSLLLLVKRIRSTIKCNFVASHWATDWAFVGCGNLRTWL